MTVAVRPPVLVTGCAGFVGFHVARALLDRGETVVGVDNLNDYYDVSLKEARLARLTGDRFSFTKGDLADAGVVEKVFGHSPRGVIHLAAQAGVRYSLTNPQAYGKSNLTAFLNVLEGCRHNAIEHLVYASSSSVYGANRKTPFSVADRVDNPISLYAATKKANELMAYTYSHLYGIPTTGLRFFTVYGPWGRPDMAYFKFTESILAGRTIDIFNNGDLKRDFTYVDDIVDGVIRVFDRPPKAASAPVSPDAGFADPPYKLYNIGNSRPVPLVRFIEILESLLERKAVRRMQPMQPGDVYATYADVSELERDVGFAPSTTIEAGLAKFVAWYTDFYGSR